MHDGQEIRYKGSKDREVCLEVEADKTSSVVAFLFETYPLKDISIEGPGLERIIESIYLQSD